jgi:hypothetical protein
MNFNFESQEKARDFEIQRDREKGGNEREARFKDTFPAEAVRANAQSEVRGTISMMSKFTERVMREKVLSYTSAMAACPEMGTSAFRCFES